MGIQATDKFQGLCLVQEDGAGSRYMRSYYDNMPALVRERVRSSIFNLCPACIAQTADNMDVYKHHKVERYFMAIEKIERSILIEEGK